MIPETCPSFVLFTCHCQQVSLDEVRVAGYGLNRIAGKYQSVDGAVRLCPTQSVRRPPEPAGPFVPTLVDYIQERQFRAHCCRNVDSVVNWPLRIDREVDRRENLPNWLHLFPPETDGLCPMRSARLRGQQKL